MDLEHLISANLPELLPTDSKERGPAPLFWSREIQRERAALASIQREAQNKPFITGLEKHLDAGIQALNSWEAEANYQLALVGTIKAGKSTLINALLGWPYAATGVTPETAVLTKFQESDCGCFFLRASYYTSEEWEEIWSQVMQAENSPDPATKERVQPFLDQYRGLQAEMEKEQYLNRPDERIEFDDRSALSEAIANLTSARSAAHYFVKEVTVGVLRSGLPPRFVLCDTPGLDDVLAYRSNVTKRYIQNANAVMVCVQSSALNVQQLSTIQNVFSLHRLEPERIFVIGTKTDNLSRPPEDWEEQKAEWMSYLQGGACYNDRSLAESHILGTAAGISLITQSAEPIEPFTPDYLGLVKFASFYHDRETLKRLTQSPETLARETEAATGIPALRDYIRRELYDVYKDSMERAYLAEIQAVKDEAIRLLKGSRNREEEILHSIDSKLHTVQQSLTSLEAKKQDLQTQRNQLKEELAELKQERKSMKESWSSRVAGAMRRG